MTMYAVMRHGKVSLESGKWSKVGVSDAHNRRLESQTVIKSYGKEVADRVIANDKRNQIDPHRAHYNRSLIDYEPGQKVDLKSVIKDRIEDAKASIKRKDACVAEEVMVTTSPEYWGDWKSQMDSKAFQDKLDKWQDATMKWFKKKYGNNVVQAELHLDETTPHIHLMIVPIMEKNGQNVLCAKDMFSPKELNKNQTEYAQAMEGFGLVRGQERSESKHISFHEHARMKAKDAEHKKALAEKGNDNNELVAQAYQNGRKSVLPELDKVAQMVMDRDDQLEKANATILMMSEAVAQKERQRLAALDAVRELQEKANQAQKVASDNHNEYAQWVEEGYGKLLQHSQDFARWMVQEPHLLKTMTLDDYLKSSVRRNDDRMISTSVPFYNFDGSGVNAPRDYVQELDQAHELSRSKANDQELVR